MVVDDIVVYFVACKELLAAASAVNRQSLLGFYYAEVPYPSDAFSVVHEKTWILDDTVVLSGSHNWAKQHCQYMACQVSGPLAHVSWAQLGHSLAHFGTILFWSTTTTTGLLVCHR